MWLNRYDSVGPFGDDTLLVLVIGILVQDTMVAA
jgi:hypothetical protein